MHRILLDVLTFDPQLIYSLLGIFVIVISGLAFFFNLKSAISLQKKDLDNTKENLKKLELKVEETYTKIENKISELEKKINELPNEIICLFKQLK